MTNTLAYYDLELFVAVKSFLIKASGWPKSLIEFWINIDQNKLKSFALKVVFLNSIKKTNFPLLPMHEGPSNLGLGDNVNPRDVLRGGFTKYLCPTYAVQQSVTKSHLTFANLFTPKAGARHELLFNKPKSVYYWSI